MTSARVGVPVEIDLGRSAGSTGDVDVRVKASGAPAIRLPAFTGADGHVRVRFAVDREGTVAWRVEEPADGLETEGELDVHPYDGDVPAYRHGRLRASADGRTLAHADGTPFLWIGDTWWMGLGTRLDWPDGFQALLADRATKGFSVVQLVAGPLPDFASTPEGIWHPQQANEGGWPWRRDWAGLEPAYYDAADRRIEAIVEAGLVPCIVGMWGFYGTVIGHERASVHWRNLVARYAAYPVVFCAAGEFDYPGYGEEDGAPVRRQRHEDQLAMWGAMVGEIGALDPYRNPVTLHPGFGSGRERAPAGTPVSFDMLQTSHWSYHQPLESMRRQLVEDLDQPAVMHMGFSGMLEVTEAAVAAEPRMPVVNGEPSYEGILGGNWQDVQRFDFWAGMLAGLAGFTYGADGIWQMSSADEGFANSVSRWGTMTWQDAMHHEGGRQVGLGGRILGSVEWWELVPVPPERARAAGRVSPLGAMSGHEAVYYLPSILLEERLLGMRDLPLDVPPGARRARYVDPRTGAIEPAVAVEPAADGTWTPPPPPTYADWVLIVDGAAPEG